VPAAASPSRPPAVPLCRRTAHRGEGHLAGRPGDRPPARGPRRLPGRASARY